MAHDDAEAGAPAAGARERPVARAITLAVLVLASACGGSRPETPATLPPCEPAEAHAALIAERLTNGATELRGAQAMRLDPPVGQYGWMVAAEVQQELGVWAVGPWLGGARILAVDAVARRWSDWGTAVADDTPAGKQRAELASRPEVRGVRACVGVAPG